MITKSINKYLTYSIFLLGGLFVGWLLFHKPTSSEKEHNHDEHAEKATTWTCSMHPQIRMDKPGKCPICAMDLIPLNSVTTQADPAAIHFTKEAAALANVQTSVVTKQKPVKEIRLYGKIQADERLQQSQVTHIAGRIEKLLVNFTGEPVRKGQTLAVVYSPELVTAQQELLETAKSKAQQPELYEAAQERLRQWKLTDAQIASVEANGQILKTIDIVSNSSGIVTTRRANNGDYVATGTVLYDIADLSTLWALFDAYESDLPFIRKGDKLSFTVQALPGQQFSGTVAFIDPVIDAVNRVSKVRVEIGNQSCKLKPEMFATGMVNANLQEYHDKLTIPRSAVLWTGKRSIVYVKQPDSDEPVFKLREIELGPTLGNSYLVESGLTEGEEIVTQGAFSVDAAAQLEGKPSMMNMPNSDPSAMTNGQEVRIKVFGNCDMCKQRIEEAAMKVNGVKLARWDADTRLLTLNVDASTTSVEAVEKQVANAGHDTEHFKAPDSVYKALPECCLYR